MVKSTKITDNRVTSNILDNTPERHSCVLFRAYNLRNMTMMINGAAALIAYLNYLFTGFPYGLILHFFKSFGYFYFRICQYGRF